MILLMFSIHINTCIAQNNNNVKAEPIIPALLVIDVQNEYLPKMEPEGIDTAMYLINNYITIFRENGFPVIRVYHTDKKSGPKPGMMPFEFPESILIQSDDPRVIKYHGDAFFETELDKILKEQNVNTVFLCGLSATGCVLATYFGADNYGYKAYLLKSALMSKNTTYTKFIEKIYEAVDLNDVLEILNKAER